MHLLVLSAFRHTIADLDAADFVSLNAPFGAQCFPTLGRVRVRRKPLRVSMHLLVLSAFRPVGPQILLLLLLMVSMHLLVLSAFRLGGAASEPRAQSEVSMHLLVLSAFRPDKLFVFHRRSFRLNAPFGAQCFPTRSRRHLHKRQPVSMHLLVLSAFRPEGLMIGKKPPCLNAPFGAQCFPTKKIATSDWKSASLNAPFGAQCFPTEFQRLKDFF